MFVGQKLIPVAKGFATVRPAMMPADSENELLDRCRKGDAAAWDYLFDLHYDAVGRFVFQFSPEFTREDAADLSQEVFLTVIRKLSSFKGDCRFQTWLFSIAANKARDLRERRRTVKRGGGRSVTSLDASDPVTGRAFEAPSSDIGPDTALIRRENSMLIGYALDGLQDACREIIELRYFGDLSYGEIGGVMNLNEKTVSSRLSRCLDRLEELVKSMFERERKGV